MKHPLIINSNGKAGRKPTVRRSLPYQGIARRHLDKTDVQKAIDEYFVSIDKSVIIRAK